MGIIQRQSIKKSIVTYIGVVIGVINTLFIYPMAVEEYGVLQFLIATASLFLPLSNFGLNTLVIRFFPEFENKATHHHGFLGLLLIGSSIAFLLFLGLVFLFKGQVIAFYSNQKPIILEYLPYAIPLVYLLVHISLFTLFTSNFKRVVIPSIIHELFLKIALPCLILLYLANFLTLNKLVYGLLATYSLVTLGVVAYLFHLGEFSLKLNFGFLNKDLVKRMRTFAIYGLLGSLGSILAFRIDTFMVASILDFHRTGVYSLALFIGGTIEIPMRAMQSIAAPVISQASKRNDWEEIGKLYRKSSITLLLAGCFLFLLVWLNLNDLLSLLPRGEVIREGTIVILFIALAKLVDLATSINGYIISYSRYFRFSFYAVLGLAVVNIVLNIILIPRIGMMGAAIATMFSIILYNLARVLFVWYKFNLSPFTRNTVYTLLLSGAVFGLVILIPLHLHPLGNIILKTIIITVAFWWAALHYKLSEDINELVAGYWDKFIVRKK